MIPSSIDRKSINQSVLIGKAILQNDNGNEKSFNETNAPEKPSVLSETEFIYLFIYLTDVGHLLRILHELNYKRVRTIFKLRFIQTHIS